MLRKSEKLTSMCVAHSNSKEELLNVDIPEIDIPKRIEKYNAVTEFFEQVDVQQFHLCISEKDNHLNQYFENVSFLDCGLFGVVYRVTLKSDPKIDIVVKEELVNGSEDKRVVENLNSRWQMNKNQPIILNEAKIGLLINNIIFGNQFPGFLLTFNVAFCDYSASRNSQDCSLGNALYSNIFMEQASSTLNEYIDTLKNTSVKIVSEKMTSILHQVLIGLHILQWRYQIRHGDLLAQNIFLFNVSHEGGYFKYIIGDDVYYVKNIGVLACLGDFGGSQSFHPSHCERDGYLGQRNVEIVGDKMIPLIDLDNHGNYFVWDNDGVEVKIPPNNVFLDKLYNFDRPVDWTDSLKFPSEEFVSDMETIFGTILSVFEELEIFPPNFTKTCEILRLDDESLLLDLNQGSILLRADLMLKHLYKSPQLDKIPVIREYCVR